MIRKYKISRPSQGFEVPVTHQWKEMPGVRSFPYQIEFIDVAGTVMIRFKKNGEIIQGAGIVIEGTSD